MKAEILAEHYQKTFELTLTLWQQRNRILVTLLLVVGVGTLLTFNVKQAEPLLVDFVAKMLSIDDEKRLGELRSSFPYGVIQSVILMIILYLMIQLYHRTVTIIRNYEYLACLENEIRSELEMGQHTKSFTRESTFYSKQSPSFSKKIGFAYILILGLLLLAFLGMRIYTDIYSKNIFAIISDSILAFTTLLFFAHYAYSSSNIIRSLFPKKKEIKQDQSEV